MRSDYLCHLLCLIALSFAGASASAAAVIVLPLTDLPWLQILVGTGIACLGGVAQIAMRAVAAIRFSEAMVREGKPPVFPPPLMPAALWDLLISAIAGMVGMAAGMWSVLDHWQMLLLLLAAGMMGSKFLQPLGEALVAGATEAARRTGGMFGSSKPDDKAQ